LSQLNNNKEIAEEFASVGNVKLPPPTASQSIQLVLFLDPVSDCCEYDMLHRYRGKASDFNDMVVVMRVCEDCPETVDQVFHMSANIKTVDGCTVELEFGDQSVVISEELLIGVYKTLPKWLKKRETARDIQRREQVKRVPSDTRSITSLAIPQTTSHAARMQLIDNLIDSGDIVASSRFDELDRMVQMGCTVELDALTKQRSISGGRKRKTNRKQLILGFDSTTANTTTEAIMRWTRELVAAFDTGCAMTMMILLSDATQHPFGYIEYSATKLKRARGRSGKVKSKERRRWDQHLTIMKDAEIVFTPKDPKADGKKMPFLFRYDSDFDQETGITTAEHLGINPKLLPAIQAGMGHYFDAAIFRANTQKQDWEIRIYNLLSFLWSMSGTHKTINDKSQAMRITLGKLLSTAGIDYADRLLEKGTPWLRDRVEKVLSSLSNWDDGTERRSMFGDIRTEWNTDDILKSMITTTPPLHLLEEMQDKRSKTIEASKRQKAKREAKDQKLIEAK